MRIKALKAFTLIELLVVITIIGILSSIVMVNLSNAKASGRDAKRVADIKNIQLALQLYANDNNQYPSYIVNNAAFSPAYMSSVPMDPKNTTVPYTYVPLVAAAASVASCYTGGSLQKPVCGGASANCLNSSSCPVVRYHLGAVLEVAGSAPLSQDDDLAITTSGESIGGILYCPCKAAAAPVPTQDEIDGTPSGTVDSSGWKCINTTGATQEKCYDVGP
jgi:prepilin-type N-terminal cleavage/methylation domain-containing protein